MRSLVAALRREFGPKPPRGAPPRSPPPRTAAVIMVAPAGADADDDVDAPRNKIN